MNVETRFALLDGKKVEASIELPFASELKNGRKYFCCSRCESPEMILVKQGVSFPFFRHKNRNGECDRSGEPETESHIQMKKIVMSLFNKEDVEEEYYGINGVRPDVLLKSGNIDAGLLVF